MVLFLNYQFANLQQVIIVLIFFVSFASRPYAKHKAWVENWDEFATQWIFKTLSHFINSSFHCIVVNRIFLIIHDAVLCSTVRITLLVTSIISSTSIVWGFPDLEIINEILYEKAKYGHLFWLRLKRFLSKSVVWIFFFIFKISKRE